MAFIVNGAVVQIDDAHRIVVLRDGRVSIRYADTEAEIETIVDEETGRPVEQVDWMGEEET